ncbi:MAG: HDOD domain-containing protein, partial [bacterium]
MSLTASDLISKDSKVPSLPTIFLQINEAVNKPRSSMRDIARIISADQGLSARLLRIANSVFYGFPSKIDTISRAITIIGTKQLRDLALATTVIQMFRGMPT